MRSTRVNTPRISPATLRFFSRYAEWYVRRNVHAVRILRGGFDLRSAAGPLIVCLNHPSWWDPLLAAMLAFHLLPDRRHYAPIEAKMLLRYRLFERIGFFGVEQGTVSGAAQFLRTSRAILEDPKAVLWITAQGEFVDVRRRPITLRSGLGHLAAEIPSARVIPLGVEYCFWDERFPEALCAFGAPVPCVQGQAPATTAAIANALGSCMDRLAQSAIARDSSAFDLLLAGNAGIGGVYDAWRKLTSRLRGETFRREHGAERI
jgi:hypothetical protein